MLQPRHDPLLNGNSVRAAGNVVNTALTIASLLERLRLPYAFSGAVAQNFWATVRGTQDIDVLVSVPSVRFGELADALDEDAFTMKDARGRSVPVSVEAMISQERSRHIIVYHGLVKVELALAVLPLQQSILRRSVAVALGNRQVPTTRAEDQILLKMALLREKDPLDIRGILCTQRGKLDLDYLREWAEKMLSGDRAEELEDWIQKYGS